MKKTIILALAIALTFNLAAQQSKPKPQDCKKEEAKEWVKKMQEKRKAYVISKMELSDTEKAAFTAIYDDFRRKYDQSRGRMKAATRHMNDSSSNEQYEKNLEIINNERKMQAETETNFYEAMKKTLSARQIYLYYKADRAFNKLMMRDMHHDKGKHKK